MPKLRHMSVFLLAATLYASRAMAQPGTGTLRGTMTDDSGAVIPAANVTLRSEEHTSELQSLRHLVCRLLLEISPNLAGNARPQYLLGSSWTHLQERLELFSFFHDTATTEIYTLSLHDALPISASFLCGLACRLRIFAGRVFAQALPRSEEHTSELQSLRHLVCRLLLEKTN